MTPSSSGLSDSVRELARTLQLDADATIRGNQAMAYALHDTLPRLSISGGASNGGGDLELLEMLGEGGMGQVRLARQRALDRDVALKMLGPKVDARADLLIQEGVITGRLEHPNIVPVHMLGRDEQDRPVLVMKRIEGVPWSALDVGDSAVDGPDPLTRHLEVFVEVCNAVAFAHDRGYVHRDIKPSNVMIGRFGEVYLLDWGISAPIGVGAFDHVEGDGPGMPLGTPLYMAPEMCRTNGVIDARTDVYLLGATLHRILTGTMRHAGDDVVTVLMNAAQSKPYDYRGEIPDELAAMLNKATARRPEDRHRSALELRDAATAYLRHRSSIDLAREAEVLLARMEKLAGDDDPAAVRRAFTECRFAFMLALKDWPDNERAREGLMRCLAAMGDVELSLGQLDAAQALLDEMATPDAALQARLDAARSERAIEQEQVASLRRLAREMDPSVAMWPRIALLVLFTLLVGGTITYFAGIAPDTVNTPEVGLWVMVPFAVCYLGAAIAFRQQLFKTLLNRRLMILIAIALAAMTINRALAMVARPPFEYMLGVDLFLIAALSAAAGVTMQPGYYLPALIWTAGFAGLVLMPERPMLPYGLSQIAGLIAWGMLSYKRKR